MMGCFNIYDIYVIYKSPGAECSGIVIERNKVQPFYIELSSVYTKVYEI